MAAYKEIDPTDDKKIYQFFNIVGRKGNLVHFRSKFEGYVSVPNLGIPDNRHAEHSKNSKLPQRETIIVNYDTRVIKWKFETPVRMNSLEGWVEYRLEEEKIFTFPKNGPVEEQCLYKSQRWCSKTNHMIDHYEKVVSPNVFHEHSFVLIVLIDLLGEEGTFTKDTYKMYSIDDIPEFKGAHDLFHNNLEDNLLFPYLQGDDLADFFARNNVKGNKAKQTVLAEFQRIQKLRTSGKLDHDGVKAGIRSFVGRLMMFKHFSDLIPLDHLNNLETIWPIVKVYDIPWLRKWLEQSPAKLKSFIASAQGTDYVAFKEYQTYLLDLIRQVRTARISMPKYSQFNNIKEAHDFATILYRRVTNKGGEKEKLFLPERRKEIAKLKLANKITFEIPKTRADLKGYGQDLNFCIGSYTPSETKILLAIRKDGKLTYCVEINRKGGAGVIEDWYFGQFKAKHNQEPDKEDRKIVTEGLLTNLLLTPKPKVVPKVKKVKEVKKIAV